MPNKLQQAAQAKVVTEQNLELFLQPFHEIVVTKVHDFHQIRNSTAETAMMMFFLAKNMAQK